MGPEVRGSGSMLATLAHGLPQLMLPAGADQFGNAEVCRAAGLALVLLPDQVTEAALTAELLALLGETPCRRRAEEVAAEIAHMPSAAEAAAAVVEWAQTRDIVVPA
jgi:UDP:flavonoid glycosyltransferase YjiC (YdhE family)